MMVLLAVDWTAGIEAAWSDVARTAPKVGAFLLTLVVGFLVAKLLAKSVVRLLERAGFNKGVERSGLAKTMAGTGVKPADVLAKLVQYAVALVVLQLAFSFFGPNPVSALLNDVIAYLPHLFVAMLIVVVAMAMAAAVREVLTAAIGGVSYGSMVANGAAIAVVAVGVFAALNQIGVAPEIVNGLFYAALAIAVGVVVIAVGGSGAKAMEPLWRRSLGAIAEQRPDQSSEPAAIDLRDGAPHFTDWQRDL